MEPPFCLGYRSAASRIEVFAHHAITFHASLPGGVRFWHDLGCLPHWLEIADRLNYSRQQILNRFSREGRFFFFRIMGG